jgi:hypothetical protein
MLLVLAIAMPAFAGGGNLGQLLGLLGLRKKFEK